MFAFIKTFKMGIRLNKNSAVFKKNIQKTCMQFKNID